MNTTRAPTPRLDEKITNAEVPPRGNQDPHLKEVANDDQSPANRVTQSDENIRVAFLKMVHGYYF